jgi:hypothetical protein
MKPSLVCLPLLLVAMLASPCPTDLRAQSGPPSLFLWAWERPEDLRFIDPAHTGVAYLAGTVWLRGSGVVVRPRMQPLRLPDSTDVLAVVRIETRRAALTAEQRHLCATEMIRLLPFDRIVSLQIDFDAAVSQRPFYAALLSELRSQLPRAIDLSITALASWCTWDDWLSALPIQEGVPMLFRMGKDSDRVIGYLRKNGTFGVRKCRASVGISTDEAIRQLPPSKNIYVFNPRPWSKAELDRVTDEVRRWRAVN